MSRFATFQASVTVRSPPRRPIPIGFGLLAAAATSLSLWAGLFWLVGVVV